MGTAANFEGNFTFTVSSFDTLVISFIGYKTLKTPVKSLVNNSTLCLEQAAVEIKEVKINAESNFLYQLVQECRKNKQTIKQKAKSYFLLRSNINDQQVELIETYYNGTYKNYNLSNLDLKIGRVYLAPYNGNFYVSLGTSLGINLHKTFEPNLEFPTSPLELGQKRLKKEFQLNFSKKFIQEGNTVYVIDFKAREKKTNLFHGKLWIDSTNAQLLKINIKSTKTTAFPFKPIGEAQKIDYASFDITKTFKKVNNNRSIQSIDFNYELAYIKKNQDTIVINTEAVLFAYDYDGEFLPPIFKSEYRLNDYESLVVAPYNHFFWSNNNNFSIETLEDDKNFFLQQKSTNYINTFSFNRKTKEISFNQPTFRKWDEKRIGRSSFTNQPDVNPQELNIYEKYKLDIKIFMDINKINDSIDVQLATVFDPFSSYCLLDNTPQVKVFINLYFDLVELYKRKLEEEVKTLKDQESILKSYNKCIAELQEISKEYFQDVIGGNNLNQLAEWNQYISYKIKINNLEYFGLDPETAKSIKNDY